MTHDDDASPSNASPNPTFGEIVAARMSRRDFLGGGLAAAALSVGGVGQLLAAVPASVRVKGRALLGFESIPVSSADSVVTTEDPEGARVLGTLNNCAMGYTPWGTYLACEENFNGYFRKNGPPSDLERRYGITAAGFGYLWHTTDARFQVDVKSNEPNRFGWVVEIDPFKPRSTPVKRTALGRMKHEGAWVQETRHGKVVYMGDDEQFEYIYRYVSNLPWRTARRRGIDPLDDGILHAARFSADGSGEWLPLTPDNPALAGWSPSDILINTRGAADAAGATKMDRPEWIDTFAGSLTAIATLTNNTRRGTGINPPTDAPAARPAPPAW